jgi:hypothetical protein
MKRSEDKTDILNGYTCHVAVSGEVVFYLIIDKTG